MYVYYTYECAFFVLGVLYIPYKIRYVGGGACVFSLFSRSLDSGSALCIFSKVMMMA